MRNENRQPPINDQVVKNTRPTVRKMNRGRARGGRGYRGGVFVNTLLMVLYNDSLIARGTGSSGRGGFAPRDAGPPEVVLGSLSLPNP